MKLSVLSSSSAGNSYLLEAKDSALIIECGVSLERMLRAYKGAIGKIEGCVISHEHGDHAHYAGQYAQLGIRIISAPGTLAAMKFYNHRKARAVKHLTTMTSGDWKISAFGVKHDAAEPFGYIIEHPECGRILFATDTCEIRYNFRKMHLDHVLIETNYSHEILSRKVGEGKMDTAQANRVQRSHFACEDACEWVKSNTDDNLKTVILLHLSDRNADADAFQEAMTEAAPFASVAVAKPGLMMELDKFLPCAATYNRNIIFNNEG